MNQWFINFCTVIGMEFQVICKLCIFGMLTSITPLFEHILVKFPSLQCILNIISKTKTDRCFIITVTMHNVRTATEQSKFPMIIRESSFTTFRRATIGFSVTLCAVVMFTLLVFSSEAISLFIYKGQSRKCHTYAIDYVDRYKELWTWIVIIMKCSANGTALMNSCYSH